MQITALLQDSNLVTITVPDDATLDGLKTALEKETQIPKHFQKVFYNDQFLTQDNATVDSLGIKDGELVSVSDLRSEGQSQSTGGAASTGGEQQASRPPLPPRQPQQNLDERIRLESEGLRQRAMTEPSFMQKLQRQAPHLAAAVQDPTRFTEMWGMIVRHKEAELDRERQLAELQRQLDADPYNVEAQKKLEEMIRQQRVDENREAAREHIPESFVRVHMLYIPVTVNNHPIKAFVDSGAQATIMSPDCAERCGIMRLLDTSWGGIAKGVGTAKILGRVNAANIAIGGEHFLCSFTVMEGKDVDLLLGLDMLRRFRGVIDLNRNKLKFGEVEVDFLAENELPKNAFGADEPVVEGPGGAKIGGHTGAVIPPDEGEAPPSGDAPAQQPVQEAQPQPQAPAAGQAEQPAATGAARFEHKDIRALMDLGATEQEAVGYLELSGGNVETAAHLYFQGQ